MRLRNSILAVLMLVIISSGCIDSPENTGGGDEVTSPWQVTEMSFSEKPVKGEQTTLIFQIESKQNINDSRIKIHLPENTSIEGRDTWSQKIPKDETYNFTRNITFRDYGLYKIRITAGMYREESFHYGHESKYINITESGTEIMDTLPQENDSGNTQETVKNQSEQP